MLKRKQITIRHLLISVRFHIALNVCVLCRPLAAARPKPEGRLFGFSSSSILLGEGSNEPVHTPRRTRGHDKNKELREHHVVAAVSPPHGIKTKTSHNASQSDARQRNTANDISENWEDSAEIVMPRDKSSLFVARFSNLMAHSHMNLRIQIRDWIESIKTSLKTGVVKDGEVKQKEFGPVHLKREFTGVAETLRLNMSLMAESNTLHLQVKQRYEVRGNEDTIGDRRDVDGWNVALDVEHVEHKQEEEEEHEKEKEFSTKKNSVAHGRLFLPLKMRLVENNMYGVVGGTVLIFAFAYVMFSQYLTSHSDEHVRYQSRVCVSLSIAIFLAVTLEKAQTCVIYGIIFGSWLDEEQIEELEAKLGVLISACYFVSMSYASFICRGSPKQLYAVQVILMHVGVFVAIDSLGTEEEDVVNYIKLDNSLIVALFAFVPVITCGGISWVMRNRRKSWEEATKEDGMSEEHERHDEVGAHEEEPEWLEVAAECECEFSGILFGYLMAKAVFFKLFGVLHVDFFRRDALAQNSGIGTVLSIGVFIALLSYLTTQLHDRAPHSWHRAVEYLEGHACFFSCFYWLDALSLLQIRATHYFILGARTWGQSPPPLSLSRTNRLIGEAFVASPILAIMVICISYLRRTRWIRGYTARAIMKSTGLFIGIIWETAFNSAFTCVSTDLAFNLFNTTESFAKEVCAFLTFMGAVATVYPAWYWYMVPLAIASPPADKEAHVDTVNDMQRLSETQPGDQRHVDDMQRPSDNRPSDQLPSMVDVPPEESIEDAPGPSDVSSRAGVEAARNNPG